MKSMKERTTHLTEQSQTEEKLSGTVNTSHHMARDVHDVRRQTILRKYAGVRADRPPIDDIRQRAAKTMKKWRWQHMNLTW